MSGNAFCMAGALLESFFDLSTLTLNTSSGMSKLLNWLCYIPALILIAMASKEWEHLGKEIEYFTKDDEK